MDLKLKRLIDAGQKAGPAIDATAPYLKGVNTFSQMRELKGPTTPGARWPTGPARARRPSHSHDHAIIHLLVSDGIGKRS
jgi:hypothetical protein